MLANVPSYLHMTEMFMDELPWRYILIRMKDPDDHATIDQMVVDFKESVSPNTNVGAVYTETKAMDSVKDIVDVTFSMTIAIMMFLCFFSLTTSMSANLYDQSKEIGILRAIGVTKGRIRLLFFYEALILVIASCLLGIFVGTVVGYTMTI